jgi:hypothetical protein
MTFDTSNELLNANAGQLKELLRPESEILPTSWLLQWNFEAIMHIFGVWTDACDKKWYLIGISALGLGNCDR